MKPCTLKPGARKTAGQLQSWQKHFPPMVWKLHPVQSGIGSKAFTAPGIAKLWKYFLKFAALTQRPFLILKNRLENFFQVC